MRLASTIAIVTTADHRIQLACGSGSARQTCTLDDPAMIRWLFDVNAGGDPIARAAALLELTEPDARGLVAMLVARGVLVDAITGPASGWPAAARALHAASVDLAFESTAEAAGNQQDWVAAHADDEPSPPLHRERAGPRVPLPADSPLARVLVDTFGVTGEFDFAPWGTHALKTSPSLGARHAIDGWVIRDGCAYAVDSRDPAALVRVSDTVTSGDRVRVVLSVHWPRLQWKYRHARYYSMAIYDAGHVWATLELAAAAHGFAATADFELDAETIAATLRIDELVDGPVCVIELQAL